MKALKVCFLAGLLFAPGLVLTGQAAPKTQAQRNHERAQLRAAQREAAQERAGVDVKAQRRTREHEADLRGTARDHRNDQDLGDDISRNADEAHDNLKDVGKDIRDWFGW